MKSMQRWFNATPDAMAAVGGEIIAWDCRPGSMHHRVIGRFADADHAVEAAAATRAAHSDGNFVENVREMLAPAAPGLSRAQRRQLERQERKAAKRRAGAM